LAPSCVDLIQGASKAIVLSDVGTGATGRAGKLPQILVGCKETDRDPPGAMRPRQSCLERKTFSPDFIFSAAELFTDGEESPGKLLLALG